MHDLHERSPRGHDVPWPAPGYHGSEDAITGILVEETEGQGEIKDVVGSLILLNGRQDGRTERDPSFGLFSEGKLTAARLRPRNG